ncbi:NAD-dependent epimerase/dehydratase family protein [Paenibacillus sp. 598K]|uniref:NAD-dependent epimerase/dehydratase family protein n=1 Tax=Paenibacillus sp. 598K TaxID=1117987 RepID=UPI0016235017|nr:NAD-dependent epimerase/dehydratase family protein [Paenibacillus sp. 598K]
MKILVIGGTGFIGPFAINELYELGHTIALFNRGNTPSSLPGITQISGDTKDLASYRSEFERFNPDVVIHMIAYTEQDARLAMNVFAGIAKRIVVLSSMDVYQAYGIILGLEDTPPLPMPLREDSPLRHIMYPYGGDYEKIKVEQVVLSQPVDLPGTVLRLPMVYGPGDPSHRLFKYVKRSLDSRSFLVLDESFSNWRATRGYVGNVAHAITVASINNHAANRIYNVGDAFAYNEHEWINAIADVMKWSVKVHSVMKSELPKQLVNQNLQTKQNWIMDTTRIQEELDYKELYTLAEALEATVQWEKDNPPVSLHPKEFPLFDYDAEDLFIADHP